MKKPTKNEVKRELEALIQDDDVLITGSPEEIIYRIDDINIYGGYEMGVRGIDHNILLDEDKNIGWEELIEYGTVVVPETKTYISDNSITDFDNLGYTNVPTNDNHIIKSKKSKPKNELESRIEKLRAKYNQKENSGNTKQLNQERVK